MALLFVTNARLARLKTRHPAPLHPLALLARCAVLHLRVRAACGAAGLGIGGDQHPVLLALRPPVHLPRTQHRQRVRQRTRLRVAADRAVRVKGESSGVLRPQQQHHKAPQASPALAPATGTAPPSPLLGGPAVAALALRTPPSPAPAARATPTSLRLFGDRP